MSKIIVPPAKSVLTPEKQYEAWHAPAEKMRDALFVGSIMNIAETIHQSEQFKSPIGDWTDIDRPTNAVEAAQAIMFILNECVEREWNVAVEMLNWKKNYIANKIKEKIHADEGKLDKDATTGITESVGRT
jgi:hypothetical protein